MATQTDDSGYSSVGENSDDNDNIGVQQAPLTSVSQDEFESLVRDDRDSFVFNDAGDTLMSKSQLDKVDAKSLISGFPHLGCVDNDPIDFSTLMDISDEVNVSSLCDESVQVCGTSTDVCDKINASNVHDEDASLLAIKDAVFLGQEGWLYLPKRNSFRSSKVSRLASHNVFIFEDVDWLVDEQFWGLDIENKPCGSNVVHDECESTIPDNIFHGAHHSDNCKFCVSTFCFRDKVLDMVKVHRTVFNSGQPNYLGFRFPVPSHLVLEQWKQKLEGFYDNDVLKFLTYGWPIALVGLVPPRGKVSNHKGATEFAQEVDKYVISEVQSGHVLGPFKNTPGFHSGFPT